MFDNRVWQRKLSYDAIGRLDKAEEYRGDTNALSYRQKFDYDRFGNLYRKAANNPTAGQENPLPFTQIEDADISKQTNRFTADTQYDDAGNVIQDTQFRQQNFWYDANGRMIKTANTNNINKSNAVYDASGNRVATQVDDVWTFFVYDAMGKKIAEYGGLQSTDEGGVKYVLQDHQGSSRAILSNSGYVQARMDYTAFGEEINANVGLRTTAQGFGATETLNQKYALTERDKETGLDHTAWRKLENRAGRWTSPDPYNGSIKLVHPQSFNRYNYVENDPVNFTDPSGLLLSTGNCRLVATFITGFDTKNQQTYYVYACEQSGGGGSGRSGLRGSGGGSGASPPPQADCDASLTRSSDLDTIAQYLFGESDAGNATTYKGMSKTISSRYRMGLKEFGCSLTDVLDKASTANEDNPEPYQKAASNEGIKSLNPQRCEAYKKAQLAAANTLGEIIAGGKLHSVVGFPTAGEDIPLFWLGGVRSEDPANGKLQVGDTTFYTYYPSNPKANNAHYLSLMQLGQQDPRKCK